MLVWDGGSRGGDGGGGGDGDGGGGGDGGDGGGRDDGDGVLRFTWMLVFRPPRARE